MKLLTAILAVALIVGVPALALLRRPSRGRVMALPQAALSAVRLEGRSGARWERPLALVSKSRML